MVVTTNATGKVFRVLPAAPPGEVCYECNRRHQRWRTVARCLWPGALWIAGGGFRHGAACYALAAYCHGRHSGGLTVTLWNTLAGALESKQMIDACGCGGGCYNDHRIYVLHDGTPRKAWADEPA